jgi:hypothetical protein
MTHANGSDLSESQATCHDDSSRSHEELKLEKGNCHDEQTGFTFCPMVTESTLICGL